MTSHGRIPFNNILKVHPPVSAVVGVRQPKLNKL